MRFLKSKVLPVFLVAALMVGTFSPLGISVIAANPYLPLWEHIPDGEPRVFEDPDNPGQYRVYIIGSHDVRSSSYCGADIRAWSAPVEDLNHWRDEGPIFTFQDPSSSLWDIMYAPDLVEVLRRDADGNRTIKEYYLIPNDQNSARGALVAKGPTPVGPFEPVNLNADGRTLKTGSILGFDPAIYIEYVDDPSDPDYEIGFRAYGYWGYQESSAAELDQNTMYSIRPGTEKISHFIPASSSYGVIRDPAGTVYPYVSDDDLSGFNFFEASSIRKVGNKYVWVYSGYSGPDYGLGSTNSALRYAYGDTPLGPWKSGGVLVDSRAPVANQNGTALQTTYSGHNTHGSIQLINDQWYVFYHRAPRGSGYARQAMVSPIAVHWDTKSVADGGKVTITGYDPYAANGTWTAKAGGHEYTGAEVTSEGFMMYGLDPYKYYSAGIASYLSDPGVQTDSWNIWDDGAPLANIRNNHVVGYKYFGFGGLSKDTDGLKAFEGTKAGGHTRFNLFLTPKTSEAFKVNVWLDGPWDNAVWNGTNIGVIEVPANSASEVTQFSIDVSGFVDALEGKNAIFLVAEGGSGNLFDLTGLGFSADGKELVRPVAPTVSIQVDGEELALPGTPVRSSESNGITGYDIYETVIARFYTTAEAPKITASASSPDVSVTVNPIDGPFGTASVVFTYKGVKKTYNIKFESDATYAISATTPVSFGWLKEGYTRPDAQTVTVTNTGTGPVTLEQPTATNYDVGTLSTTVLAGQGATATFTIRPKAGLTTGNYDEAIIVSGSNRARTIISASFTVANDTPGIVITGQPKNAAVTEGSISGSLSVDAKIDSSGGAAGPAVSANTIRLPDVVTPNIGWSDTYIYDEDELTLQHGQAFKLEFTVDLEAGTRFFVEAPQQPGNNGGYHPAMRNASGPITDGPMSNGYISKENEGLYDITWYGLIEDYQLKTYNNPASPGPVTMTNVRLTLYTGQNDPSLLDGEWAKITTPENGVVEAARSTGAGDGAGTGAENTDIALSYQWYANTTNSNTGGTAIQGATGRTFSIPTTLTAGSYYYYAVVSAAGETAAPAVSNAATVVVSPAAGSEPGPATPGGSPTPKTGDTAPIAILAIIFVLAAVGVAVVLKKKKV